MIPSDDVHPVRDALAFCGRVPWPLIAELADGDEVAGCFVLREVRRLQTRSNQPFLRLVLGDRTGSIEGVIWEDIERWEPFCVPKAVVGVRGRVSFYQDRPQLRILSIEPIRAAAADMQLLLPASRRDREVMERELDAIVASVRDRPLRGLLRRCLGRETELGRSFRDHQAATRNHHAYLHGLLEHTLSVATTCDRIAGHYFQQGVPLDRDLLLTGALLHDIGKVIELEGPPVPNYTTPGKLLGHIVLGIQAVGREALKVPGLDEERLLLVQHLIASHQGKPEWDSPRVPQLLEGLILHYADDLDAKINQAMAAIGGTAPGDWSSYDRSLARSFYLPAIRNPPPPPSREAPRDPGVIDLFRG
jgi:3'-5' exoribonuclease